MEQIKKVLSRAVIRVLEPLVHLLLRHNVSHSEFSELARRAYVNVAFKHFTLPNRKPSYSRVSVITGLSRKEVVRLAAIEADEPPSTKRPQNRAQQVVNGWMQDPDFLDKNKQPRVLSLQNGELGFEELVRRYSGGITARAILDELIRVGTVSKPDKTSVKLNDYGFVPESSDAELIEMLARHASDLLNTGLFNIERDRSIPARFQRQVTYLNIPQRLAQEFEAYSHEKLLMLIVELNQWLASRKNALQTPSKQSQDKETTEPLFRLGAGAYFFKNTQQED
jgi:hypothetical protein